MSWPIKDKTIDGTDWSWWQQNPDKSFIDVDAFMAQNPNIKVAILRACWINGNPDKSYAVYYDAFQKHNVIIIAYLWPNPLRADMQDRWLVAIGDRIPDGIMLDFELTFYQTDAKLTKNAKQSFEDAKIFQLPILGYTRGEWWSTHIKQTIEIGKQFIIAHYPHFLLDGKWQQCRNHTELHCRLPIGNSFTPYLGRIKKEQVIGWQFSEKGRLAPYVSSMDLDSLILADINKMFTDQPENPPATERAKVLVTYTGPVDVSIVTI